MNLFNPLADVHQLSSETNANHAYLTQAKYNALERDQQHDQEISYVAIVKEIFV